MHTWRKLPRIVKDPIRFLGSGVSGRLAEAPTLPGVNVVSVIEPEEYIDPLWINSTRNLDRLSI